MKKTKADLDALIPAICALMEEATPEYGESYWYMDEDGRYSQSDDYAYNGIAYEEDGWLIEVGYRCCASYDDEGNTKDQWGELTDINASWYDDDTDELTEFSEEETEDLWKALEEYV